MSIILTIALLALACGAARAAAPAGSCDTAAAALAPAGGLPADWVQSAHPRHLFFQALADFSYEKDFAVGTRRKTVGPCLTAWGAKDWERVSATSPLGADVHALVVRTNSDVIIVFRGMDSRRDAEFMDSVIAPTYDAAYFGDKAAAAAAAMNKTRPDGKPHPDAFWTLEGYTDSYKAIRGPLDALLKKWEPKLPAGYKVWYVGHSDGSQLAQLAALKAADVIGADRVGGVILYGPSRVGSRGFAKYYNSLLGGKTVYYSYGRDPAANTDYTMADGLMFPGVGLYACPFKANATETLVVVPLGADRADVCSEIKPTNGWLARLTLPDFVLDTSDPAMDELSSYEYLPHHIPAITYDGLTRILASGQGAAKPDACAAAALALPQCVISTKCSTALRPTGATKCRGCASDATCTQSWGMPGARCDRAWSELSGWMCYSFVPGTQLNLYMGYNGAPKTLSDVVPEVNLNMNVTGLVSSLGRKRMPFTQNSHRVGK